MFETIEEAYGSDILDEPVEFAVNADNVSDMISCFLNYGEGTVDEIIGEIKKKTRGNE